MQSQTHARLGMSDDAPGVSQQLLSVTHGGLGMSDAVLGGVWAGAESDWLGMSDDAPGVS